MAKISDIFIQASELQPGISCLLRNSTYPRYDDLSGLEIDSILPPCANLEVRLRFLQR